MDYIFLGYFLAFGLLTFIMLRYYTHRVGLSQINAFIKTKENELNHKILSGFTELEDISINLEVDVKKYHQLKSGFAGYLGELEQRKRAFDEMREQVDGFFITIRKQNKALEKAAARNQQLLSELRTSDDAVTVYEERLAGLEKMFAALQGTMTNYNKEQEGTVGQLKAAQLQRLDKLQTELSAQLRAQLAQQEQQVTNRLRRVEKVDVEQGRILEANLSVFTKTVQEETTQSLAAERTQLAAARAELSAELKQELSAQDAAFKTELAAELKTRTQALTELRGQLTPVSERVDVLETRLATCQTQLDTYETATTGWREQFTNAREDFLTQTLKQDLDALKTDTQTFTKKFSTELQALGAKKRKDATVEVEKYMKRFSKELNEELFSPTRIKELEENFTAARKQSAVMQNELAQFKTTFQRQLRERVQQLDALEQEQQQTAQDLLRGAETQLERLAARQKRVLLKTTAKTGAEVKQQGEILLQLQNIVTTELKPQLARTRTLFEQEFNKLIHNSRTDLEVLMAEFKTAQSNALSTAATQQKQWQQDMEVSLNTRLEDWNTQLLTRSSELLTEVRTHAKTVAETREALHTVSAETLPTLSERSVRLSDGLEELEKHYHHYNAVFARAHDYKNELPKLVTDISEKLQEQVSAFTTFLEQEKAGVLAMKTETGIATVQTELTRVVEEFKTFITTQEKQVAAVTQQAQEKAGVLAMKTETGIATVQTELTRVVGEFKTFITTQEKQVTAVTQQAQEKAGVLAMKRETGIVTVQTELTRVVGEFKTFITTQEKQVAAVTQQAQLNPMLTGFNDFLAEQKLKISDFVTAKLTMLSDLGQLEQELLPRTAEPAAQAAGVRALLAQFFAVRDNSSTTKGMHQQLQKVLGDFEKRLTAKFQKYTQQYTKVHVLESNFAQATQHVEQTLATQLAAAKNVLTKALAAFKKQLSEESVSVTAAANANVKLYVDTERTHARQTTAIVTQLEQTQDNLQARWQKFTATLQSRETEQTQLLEQTQDNLQARWQKFTANLQGRETEQTQLLQQTFTGFQTRFAEFLTSSNTEFVNYRNAIIEDYAGRIDRQLQTGTEQVTVYVAKAKTKLDKQLGEWDAGQTRALKTLRKEQEQYNGKLQRVYASVNAIAVVEQRQTKLLKLSEEQLSKLKARVRELLQTKLLSDVLRGLMNSEFEAQLKQKAKRIETRLMQQVPPQPVVPQLNVAAELSRLIPQQRQELLKILKLEVQQLLTKETGDFKEHVRTLQATTQTAWQQQQRKLNKTLAGAEAELHATKTDALKTFDKQLQPLSKELGKLTQKVSAFTEETKLFSRADVLRKELTEQLNAFETKLQTLAAKEQQVRALETKLNTLGKREQRTLTLANEVKLQAAALTELTPKLERNLSLGKELQQQSSVLAERQEAFTAFFKQAQIQQKTIITLKREFAGLAEKSAQVELTRQTLTELLGEHKRLGIQTKKMGDGIQRNETRELELREKFGHLEQQAEVLEHHYKEFKAFDEKYNQLDYLIEDIEQRKHSIEEMRKRLTVERQELETLKQTFNEQIRTLLKILYQRQTVIPAESKTAGAVTPAGTHDKLKLVEQLHAIKWSKHEIAKWLGLQLYEVDAILKQLGKG